VILIKGSLERSDASLARTLLALKRVTAAGHEVVIVVWLVPPPSKLSPDKESDETEENGSTDTANDTSDDLLGGVAQAGASTASTAVVEAW